MEPRRGGGEEGDEMSFITSELAVLPLPAQGGEDTSSRRLPVAVGREQGVEEITKLNKSLDLEIQSLRSCIVEQQGKLARERSLVLQLESDRQARPGRSRTVPPAWTGSRRESSWIPPFRRRTGS